MHVPIVPILLAIQEDLGRLKGKLGRQESSFIVELLFLLKVLYKH
jgi:hypothetical protein